MTSIVLRLPETVVQELALPYEGSRDASAVTMAIEGIAVAANVATVLTAQPQLQAIAAAIRRWRLGNERESVVLTVRGPGIDLRIDLPRNVSSERLMRQLQPLLADRPLREEGRRR
ncbi:hypothetical protein COUCH_27850 [Couchioplanes caeruleus]|uniref:hypothetical protein n=1 Tax=Couchioplanes caeruleus TaxID=56438 RepID=UPI0020BE4177|nr:hypothetical protein [Couchioplanes caeruleus]UQU62829.1 hypothetical protein COUCH_27850 [Couchioplanes caeruleus]